MPESLETSELDISQLVGNIVIPETAIELKQAQRLFHGRGHAYDNLNHITIDWLPPVILITLFEPVKPMDLDALTKVLKDRLASCESIQIQHRHQKNWPVELVHGRPISHLEALENGLKYKLHIGRWA